MFLFLRQLRQLELRKRSGRYFVYAFGEIFLIVVGIMVALQINEWNQGQINRGLEQRFLVRIQKDLDKDLENFSEQQRAGREGLESLKEAVVLIHGINTEDDVFKLNELYDLAWIETLSPQDSTYLELESTGQLNLIRDETLRLAIIGHYAYYTQMETAFDRMFVWHKNVTHDWDSKTNILKYVNWNKDLFPSRFRSENDWIFLNDPQHTHFQLTQIAIAATSFWINAAINDYTELIAKAETVKALVEESLEALD
jgi:hypothetical protein